MVMQIAEFFIQPMYRRRAVGTAAIIQLWRRFPGQWEVQVLSDHRAASAFWKRGIALYARPDWSVTEIAALDGQRLLFHFEIELSDANRR